MSATDAILSFSASQPPWIQDALRRLALTTQLLPTDVDELELLVANAEGLASPDRVAPIPTPVERTHFPPPPEPSARLTLVELRDVVGTARLAANQRIPFGARGLTVVYGDNGSGKSGYCKLLKRLCRVREGGAEGLHPNVFDPSATDHREVSIKYRVGENTDRDIRWSDGTAPPSELRRVSVFDSKTVRLYADSDGKIEFLPYGLDLLRRLAEEVCQPLSERFAAQSGDLERRCATPLPDVPLVSPAASLVAALVARTPLGSLPAEAALRAAADWRDSDATRLATIERTLAADTNSLIALYSAADTAARALQTSLAEITVRLGDGAMSGVRSQATEARAAYDAARVAAESAFAREPLRSVGSEPWRRMFEYSRKYFGLARPNESFPPAADLAPCPLCQQVLSPTAVDRLRRFDEFVRGAAETHARDCEEALVLRRRTLESLTIPDSVVATRALAGFDGLDDDLRTQSEEFLRRLSIRREEAVAMCLTGDPSASFTPLPANPSGQLAARAAQCAARLDELRAVSTSAESRRILESERDALIARRRLSEQIDVFLLRRSDLEQLHKLRNCVTACGTGPISKRITELRRELVTKAFADALKDERESLGISYLPIEVGERSERGTSYLGPRLGTARKVSLSDILSEGERNALALACFLAEARMIRDQSGLVFDDPISSLDHRHRCRVAERLVKEAQGDGPTKEKPGQEGRQVIIFTHDLVFLYELAQCAASATPPVPMEIHRLRRTELRGCGVVHAGEEPWVTRQVRRRLNDLDQKLAEAKCLESQNRPDEFRRAAVDFYTSLRETWERMVEEVLFNRVITRFQTEVRTLSLGGVPIDDVDFRQVFWGMKRASERSGHDRATALQDAPPEGNQLERDLSDLREYFKTAEARRKRLEDARQGEQHPRSASSP